MICNYYKLTDILLSKKMNHINGSSFFDLDQFKRDFEHLLL
jgi:hypothetical protein